MASTTQEPAPRSLARLAGVLYLTIIVGGLFAEVYVRGSLIVRGDPAETAARILSGRFLFDFGLSVDIVVFLADVAVAILLYFLLRPAGAVLSMVAAGFQLVGTAIYGANLLNYLAAGSLIAGGETLRAWEPAQTQALALFFLDLHATGYDLGLVFFGLHCLTLGPLLWRSPWFPSVLGVLMLLAGAGYLVGSFTRFLWPAAVDAVAPVYVLPLVGELALCGWLLARGVRGTGVTIEGAGAR